MTYHESLDELQKARTKQEFEVEIWQLTELGRNLIKRAESLRKKHRRKTRRSSTHRRLEMGELVEEISDLMKPIRSAIGKLIWIDVNEPLGGDLEKTSKELQLERAALRRMVEPRL